MCVLNFSAVGIFGSWGGSSGIYYDTPSDYEKLNGKYHFSPAEVIGKVPSAGNVDWKLSPHMLFARTPSDDNIGHILFDTYIPLLAAIDHWLSLKHAGNVVIVDDRGDQEVWVPQKANFSRYFRELVGSTLFGNTTTMDGLR